MIIVPKDIFDSMKPEPLSPLVEDRSGKMQIIPSLSKMDEIERVQWLKENAKWVGTGSSRTAFILKDMTVLKIAINDRGKGQGQNRQEYENTIDENGNSKYPCFSEIYDADKNDWSMLQVEMAREAQEIDFQTLLSLGYAGEAIIIPVSLNVCKGNLRKLMISDILVKKVIDSVDDMAITRRDELLDVLNSEKVTAIMYRILKGNERSGSERNLGSIYQFFNDNGLDKMVPADLTNEENWGVVWRNGLKQLIIIDSGFSEFVWDHFYKKS